MPPDAVGTKKDTIPFIKDQKYFFLRSSGINAYGMDGQWAPAI